MESSIRGGVLGHDDYTFWERSLRWSLAVGAFGLLTVLIAAVLNPAANDAFAPLYFIGGLAIAGGLLGIGVSVMSGRMVYAEPGGTLSIKRCLLPPQRLTGVSQIVVVEERWDLRTPTPATQNVAESSAASLTAVLADGREVPLIDVEWRDRQRLAERLATPLGAEVTTRGDDQIASCG